jgi:DNA-directed RNA polymerase specialized sigma24 family protein
MLIDQTETRAVVRQIVFQLTIDRGLREDLAQEALLHLWLREQQRPGQTQSWYFQSCRFFLQNFLRKGRSVDATRRHKGVHWSAEENESPETFADSSASDSSVLALLSAREIVSMIAKWLAPLERQILIGLAEGFGVRELATRLNVSHTSVVRHRRRIAALALKLGIEPLPNRSGHQRQFGAGSTDQTSEIS